MDTKRCQLLVEGYLDVKAPPDSPERILYKAWRRLWVSATAYLPSGRGEPHIILLLSRKQEDQQHEKQVKASRDGLRLFRCRSGSRPLRTWALSSGSSLLIYLAAKTEEETQQWMQAIRDGLWPPIVSSLTPAGTHEVSLIDDEKSFSSGLLGVYGRLVKTSEEVISVIHPHWQGTQMRWKLEDILDARLVRKVGKEDKVAGVFHLTIRSAAGDTRTLQFYSNTALTSVYWICSLLAGAKNNQKSTESKEAIGSQSEFDQTSIPLVSTSDSALEQKPKVIERLQDDAPKVDVDNNLYGKLKSPRTNLMDIPNSFLDASSSSSMFRCVKMDESSSSAAEKEVNERNSSEDSDDSPDMYEHLYEDLNTLRESRSYTVYEEVDDAEDEYVPPMTPPSLPKRPIPISAQEKIEMAQKPATLRLQKLCESVTEALKQAEETPALVDVHSSLLRKEKVQKKKQKSEKTLVEKCKSLQVSPMLGPRSSTSREVESSARKRTVSESAIAGDSLSENDLPLLPFDYKINAGTSHKKEQGGQRKQNHLPLEDLLKSLKTKEGSERVTVERRNLSEHPKIGIFQPTDKKNAKNSPSHSEQTEGQYMDMS